MKFKYNSKLPITSHRREIVEAVAANDVVVVMGETGSGKSTQLPKLLLEALCEIDKLDLEKSGFKIVSTQPRRLAATSIAAWIAEDMEVSLGREVGYKIRFDDESFLGTMITVCTDGILLQEMKSDNLLSRYDGVIIDEAHERNLNIDFLLGLIKRIYLLRKEKKLKPLKIIVTSATVDAEKFALFFQSLNQGKKVPVINVSGRMFPVHVRHEGKYMGDHLYKKIAQIIDSISKSDKKGDVLVFMPGESEIFATIRAIDFLCFDRVKCFPLFSRMTMDDQRQIFSEQDCMKVVVATNIAETSLTVPGIVYVIDSGLVKLKDFDHRTGIGSLEVKDIAQASAIQRAGRAGRVMPGFCIRMYSQEDFNLREKYTKPEIQRSDLASVVLHMVLIGIKDVYNFDFIDPPESHAFENAYRTLHELGALNQKNDLTELGVKMAHLPLEPKISAMLLSAEKFSCVKEVAVIASCLSVKDFFVRPNGEEEEADAAKKYFQKMTGRITRKYKKIRIRKGRRVFIKKVYLDEMALDSNYVSDLLTFLYVWNRVNSIENEKQRKEFCQENYLNFEIIEEVKQIFYQLIDNLRLFGGKEFSEIFNKEMSLILNIKNEIVIIKSIISGLVQNVCEQVGVLTYRSGRSDGIMIHPGSALFNLRPKWFVSAEIVETSRLYARNNTVISPNWLEEVATHLCKYNYSDLFYDKKSTSVVCDEDVFFRGHRIIRRKAVLVKQNNRYEAFEIFLREAIVKAGLRKRFSFIDKNESTRKELNRLFILTGNKKYDFNDNRRLFDWYVVKFSCFSKSELPVSLLDMNWLHNQKGEEFFVMKIEDFVSSQEMNKIRLNFPDEIFIAGQKQIVKYFQDHLRFPNGPVISFSPFQLEKTDQVKIKKSLKNYPLLKPYFVVSNGVPFEQIVAESYDIDDLKNAFDHWYLRKEWKNKKTQFEKRALKLIDIMPFFNIIMYEIELGESFFNPSKKLKAYYGIRHEGAKKYSLILFSNKEEAKNSSVSALKKIFIEKFKYDLQFSDIQLKSLKKDKDDGYYLIITLIEKIDFEEFFKFRDNKEIHSVNEFLDLKLKEYLEKKRDMIE